MLPPHAHPPTTLYPLPPRTIFILSPPLHTPPLPYLFTLLCVTPAIVKENVCKDASRANEIYLRPCLCKWVCMRRVCLCKCVGMHAYVIKCAIEFLNRAQGVSKSCMTHIVRFTSL